jgi:hypothetical protein
MVLRQLKETIELQPERLRRNPDPVKKAGGHGLPLFLDICELGPRYEDELLLDLSNVIEKRVIQRIRIGLDPEQGDHDAANLIAEAIHKRRHEIEIVEVVMRPPTMHATVAFLRKWPSLVSKLDAHGVYPGLTEFKSDVVSLPNLTELDVNQTVAGQILLEFTHQVKRMGLKKLFLQSNTGAEMRPYLASPCASNLRMLSLKKVGLGTFEMEGLTDGLLNNPSITELELSFSNSARQDATGLPILADFFRRNSSIQKLTLGGVGPGNLVLQDENLMEALASNAFITELELNNVFGSTDGGATLSRFLRSNHRVKSLQLFLQEGSLQDDNFCRAFAHGLGSNTIIRRLEFSCAVFTHPKVNLVGLLQTLAIRPVPSQLVELSMDLDSVTSDSLLELCRYVEKPNCQLQSLKCEDTAFEVQDLPYDALIRAVHQSPALKEFQLRIFYNNITLVKLALLGSASSSLAHLWIEHDGEDFFEEAELEEIKEQVLECAMANTQLEGLVLRLWDLSSDLDFQKELNSICTRNKVITKALPCLGNGTFPPSLLGKTLGVIAKECQLLDQSTGTYFNTVLFAFLRGRADDACQYFRNHSVSTGRGITLEE